MILDDIAQLIVDNTTNRTIGTNLFKGFEQTKVGMVDTVTFLHETPGRPPEFVFASSTPAWTYPRVQVVNRSSDYETARDAAELHHKVMIGQRNVTLKPSTGATGVQYLTIDAMQEPYYLGIDDNDRHKIVCNYEVWKPLST